MSVWYGMGQSRWLLVEAGIWNGMEQLQIFSFFVGQQLKMEAVGISILSALSGETD